MKPVLVINFKTYPSATGKRAVKLAKDCKFVSKKSGVKIIPAVQPTDIQEVAKLKIITFSQHMDPETQGRNTGKILPEAIKQAGAKGTLINHSEDKMDLKRIKLAIQRARKLKMISIVCAEKPSEAAKIAKFKPDFIAIEPPELIGGNVSVSTAKPSIITNTIKKVGRVRVLCGAGIKTSKDIEIAMKLGAKGILLASGVTKSRNPRKTLQELVKGF